jgi:hypothetical protein
MEKSEPRFMVKFLFLKGLRVSTFTFLPKWGISREKRTTGTRKIILKILFTGMSLITLNALPSGE